MIKREKTKEIKIGNKIIGGKNPVLIQSMTNTRTKDTKSTIKQILELEKVGCDIIRVACLDIEDAKAIKTIKSKIHIPIVADIHFDYKIALETIKNGADKIRINPGNIGSKERIKKVVEACKEKNIPIRIGVNSGSLEKINNINEKANKMIESAKRHVKILEDLDFYEICISLKSSDLEESIKLIKMLQRYLIILCILE